MRVIKGSVFDVAVDLRKNSKTFGQWYGIEWPYLIGEYSNSASAEGDRLEDGTKLNLSEKDQKWLGI